MPASFSFRGSLEHAPDALFDAAHDAVLVMATAASHTETAGRLAASAAAHLPIDGRPDATTLRETVEAVRDTGAQWVIGVGDGSLLDLAKIAAADASGSGAPNCRPLLVPTGREAYRSVTPFAVLDTDGQRPTRAEASFASNRVFILEELLSATDQGVVATTRADIAVIAIESLLSLRSTPLSVELATAVLAGASGSPRGASDRSVPSDRLAGSVIALSILGAEAMMMTRLGLSHAVASPLGTVSGQTHDAFNAILGAHAIRSLGRSAGLTRAADALAVEDDPDSVASALDAVRIAAGLPASLRELGVTWAQMRTVLPLAAASSGIPALPRQVDAADIRSFARAAWEGKP